MKIKYENDKERGPGYGKLIFTEFLAPEEPWQYSLMEAGDRKYATNNKANPWMGGINFIDAQGQVNQDGSLEILLGPAVVDILNPLDTYRVVLRGEDKNDNAGRLIIAENPILSDFDKLKTAGMEKNSGETPQPIKPDTPVSKDAEDGKLRSDSAGSGSETAGAPLEMDAPKQPDELVMEKPQKSSKRTLCYGLGTVAALFLVCLIWFLADRFTGTSDSAPPVSKNLSVEDKVKAFFADEGRTPAGASALAEELKAQTPQEQDAVYRLYYYAAEKGDPQGLMGYATALDPGKSAWGSIKKDSELALQAYARAAESNVPGAAKAQDDLLKWIEKNSRSNP